MRFWFECRSLFVRLTFFDDVPSVTKNTNVLRWMLAEIAWGQTALGFSIGRGKGHRFDWWWEKI